MNKRIAIISYHKCPLSDEKNTEIGGMGIYILELSKELVKKGYIIDIYTRFVDKNSPKIIEVLPNLRVIHIKDSDQLNVHKKDLALFIPEFLNNFYKFIEGEKLEYNLISCHYYLSGLAGLEIKNKYKIPMFITFHTLALMKNLVARDEEEKEDIERIKAEILLVQKADKIIATSKADKEYLYTLYNCPINKIFVLIPGVNLNLFKPIDKKSAKKIIKADPGHRLILFVGRIVPLKGIDVLFYALKIILEKNPKLDLCLWVVGGENMGKRGKWSNELIRLEQIRKLLGITTFVKFVGQKDQSELPNYYNASEIVIMPSNYESFGIIALEAMACGVPVITTNAAGVSDIFDKKHESLITSAGNPILLAKKIKNLLSDKKQYEKISHEVYEKVQDLGWEHVAEKFIEILV